MRIYVMLIWALFQAYRGTYDIFIQNAKTPQYAWNSAQINVTDIIIKVAAVSLEFRLLLDFKLLQTPETLNQSNSGLYEYLQHVKNNSQFAMSILQILIDE